MSQVNQALIISQLLQDNWSLTSPYALANINWVTSKVEAASIFQAPNNNIIQIALYDESKQVDALSAACYIITEKLVVDIIVKNADSTLNSLNAAECTLDALMQEVYRIIHLNDPNYEVIGEPTHGNSPDITRCMMYVNAVYFHIATTSNSTGVFT
jgi:hypothetical protein